MNKLNPSPPVVSVALLRIYEAVAGLASLGFIQIEVANKYVRNQDQHHGTVWVME